jgi:hypothetical protein
LKHNVTIKIFYGEGLLAPRPTPKLEDHPLLAVCNCLFNIFTVTLHNQRTSLHLQPEDAPCHDDKIPTIILDLIKVTTLAEQYKL